MRYFIDFSYNGLNYHGWQIQSNALTVQKKIEESLSVALQTPTQVVGAGRTDTGVHAKQMVAHFDTNLKLEDSLVEKLNHILPEDILINKLFRVKDNVHARFSAIARLYEYHIFQKKDPFNTNYYLHRNKLNIKKMNEAAKYLIGKHDFSSFAKLNSNTHTNDCNVYFLQCLKRKNKIIISIKANRFLRNMVRAIVGTLLQIGELKISPKQIQDIMKEKDRSRAGKSMPAQALFLTSIEYSKDILYV